MKECELNSLSISIAIPSLNKSREGEGFSFTLTSNDSVTDAIFQPCVTFLGAAYHFKRIIKGAMMQLEIHRQAMHRWDWMEMATSFGQQSAEFLPLLLIHFSLTPPTSAVEGLFYSFLKVWTG